MNLATPDDIRLIFREEFERMVIQLQKPQQEDTLLTQGEVITLYQVTRPTVIAWGKIGKLKPIKLGRLVYYRKSELPK